MRALWRKVPECPIQALDDSLISGLEFVHSVFQQEVNLLALPLVVKPIRDMNMRELTAFLVNIVRDHPGIQATEIQWSRALQSKRIFSSLI